MTVLNGKIEQMEIKIFFIKMIIYKGFQLKKVNFFELKPGKKYLISYYKDTQMYEAVFEKYYTDFFGRTDATFIQYYMVVPFEDKPSNNSVCTLSKLILGDFAHKKIYTIVSKKRQIQDAMEYRSLKLILKKIIGDETFEW